MEIRAGTGGDEAALFAGDLYDMYTHYARDQGWKVEDISFSPGEQGGFKEIVFSVTGDDVFQHLRYESGGHRVQRVPKTETQGRIHTSAATVAVLPEPDEVQVEIKRRRTSSGSGCGPAAPAASTSTRPKVAVRIWYKQRHAGRDGSEVPGRAQPAQELRPGHAHPAQPALRAAAAEAAPASAPSSAARLIGSGDRSERIRTYNFPQNRVTDHRINLTLYKLDAIIAGNLGELIQALRDFDKKQRLEQDANAGEPVDRELSVDAAGDSLDRAEDRRP